MGIELLIIGYIVLAAVVIYSAMELSNRVDELDKRTNIGGALIGGVMLAAVTSLPELITSLTSVLVIKDPGLAFGNVYGSNMFNMLIFAVIDIIFIKHFLLNRVKALQKSNYFVLALYVVSLLPIGLTALGLTTFEDFIPIRIGFYSVSLISLLIIFIYGISVKALRKDSVSEKSAEELLEIKTEENKRKVKTALLRFGLFAVVLIVSSIFLTQITSQLVDQLGISSSFGGAIFLGLATSLPEVTALVQLMRLRNYNAAAGNIIGSNMFNFTIIAVADIVAVNQNIYEVMMDDRTLLNNVTLLLILGLFSAIIISLSMIRKPIEKRIVYIIPSVVIILSYITYLILSAIAI